MFKRLRVLALGVLILVSLSGCGVYNGIQNADENVDSTRAQMLSVYQKRSDLIPNLVEIVKGSAAHEKTVLTATTEARASVGKLTLPKDATPEQAKAFFDAQKQLGGSVANVIAVAENYPDLKVNENFRLLQKQLTDMEDQATASRNRHIRSIKDYNVLIRKPTGRFLAFVFGYERKPQLEFDNEAGIKNTPQVKLTQ